jgi:hypothetical protein
VQKGSGTAGDNSRLAAAEVQRLEQGCKDASDAFMTHWRQDHNHLSQKDGSS